MPGPAPFQEGANVKSLARRLLRRRRPTTCSIVPLPGFEGWDSNQSRTHSRVRVDAVATRNRAVVIAVVATKGGVGKTTTAVALAHFFGQDRRLGGTVLL